MARGEGERERGARGMLSYLFECVVARDKNESTESMWRPPFPPPSSPPLDSKSWKKELERRKEILRKGEGGKGDACARISGKGRDDIYVSID